MDFRKDINGLRAIAVIAVVIFHFNESWLVGGFAGVDVFFVISGYLMTKIIVSGLEKQNFSIVFFYLSRARRIIPALAFMVLALLTFGWFYLSVVDYSTLSRHSISSLGFFSNLYYLSESGYFDVSSHKKWLLHTWSLSVEWQFYLVYPIILLLTYKLASLAAVKKVVCSLCLISFCYCVYLSFIAADSAFYILPTRAWEMMVGGIAFLYPLSLSKGRSKMLEFLGLALILLSYGFVSSSDIWPGYLAAVPVIGAYLIILANNNSIITSNSVMQAIGTYSYSIYLWHWPIVVGLAYLGLNSLEHLLVGICLSFIAGYGSYRFVESAVKFKIDTSSKMKVICFPPILACGFVALLCMVIYVTNGLPFRLDERVHVAAKEALNRSALDCEKQENKAEHCVVGKQENIVAIVLGDSHARALATSVADNVNLDSEGVLLISSSACPFILDAKITSNKHCFNSNKSTMAYIQNTYSGLPVFVINRTSVYIYGQSNPARIKKGKNTPLIYFDREYNQVTEDLLAQFKHHYQETMCTLADGNPVYITTPVPEMLVNVPDYMSNRMLVRNDYSDYSTPVAGHFSRNKFALELMRETQEVCGITLVNVEEQLCKQDRCLGSIDGRPLYFDGDHLSEYGNKLLSPLFGQVFRSLE